MKSILSPYLNMTETVTKKDKCLGFFCGINLPPDTRTTTNDHPADFSTYVNLQPTSEKYLYPTGKSPITF